MYTHRRKFISELLNTLVTAKFGNRDNEDDFSGPSDASEAPNFLINFGGSEYVISPEVDSSSPVDQSPVSTLDNCKSIAHFPLPTSHKNTIQVLLLVPTGVGIIIL